VQALHAVNHLLELTMHKIVFTLLVAAAIGFTPGAAFAADPLTPPAGATFDVSPGYALPDAVADPVADPAPSGSLSHLVWGYEANFTNAKLYAYTFAPFSVLASCVPTGPNIPATSNGRGVAFDPVDGNLWISRLTNFVGDGMIHKVTPPNVTPGTCPEITTLVVHPKDGQPVQPDYGALDVDNKSKHIWAAGYFPVSSGGALRNYFYEVNRNNGLILQSCYVPIFSDGFNDSLAVMKHTDLPGSAEYLVTDGGEFFGTTVEVIDQSSCHQGQQATVVATTNLDHAVTGIDFEWPGLLNVDEPTGPQMLFINGDFASPLWGPGAPQGPTGAEIEDISLCGYSATFGGDGSDHCPYPY
jgi:hypothetical protein